MKEKKGFEGKLDEQIKFYQAQVLGCSLLEDNRDCYRQKRKDFKKAIRSLVLEFIGDYEKPDISHIGCDNLNGCDDCYKMNIRNNLRENISKELGGE